jgi:peptidoglycan-associated lipoprotein
MLVGFAVQANAKSRLLSEGRIQVTTRDLKASTFLAVFVAILSLAGCNKKVAKATPPTPPPPPSAPTATLAAKPNVIQQGEPTVLTWQTTDSTEISIAGMGAVPASGSRSVMPDASTTYTLEAKGPGGTKDASARVTVSPKTVSVTTSPTDAELSSKNIKDVFFDYDRFNIRPNEVSATRGDASFLQQHPEIKILVEGHCDDRGSDEYNIALGTSRAESVKQSLLQQGISAERINTISYGKERPFCTQDNEQCWQQNRVGHLAIAQ